MPTDASIEKQLKDLIAGTEAVLPEDQLRKKLMLGRPLVVKLGVDPTAPDLHLGHTLVISKLKQFLAYGHHVVFLIGNFTAQIGDPSGRSKTRVPLDEQQIAHNTATYFEQVARVLDPKKISIRFNAEWLSQLNASELITLCAKTTVARIIEREDFQSRMTQHAPIRFHELLYPLMQGYDSVELKADVELGGTDQTFNLLFGRFLQEQFDMEPQVVMTVPILEGLDGVEKMSKSLGNAVSLNQSAEEAFGQLMSISDRLMWRYMHLLLGTTAHELSVFQERVAAGSTHPMALKKQMAYDIVAIFWSPEQALAARQKFDALFVKKDYSHAQEVVLPEQVANPLWIVELLKLCDAVDSSSEAKRLIDAGAVKLDGDTVSDFKAQVRWHQGMTVKVGKHRIYKIVLE